MYDKATAEAKKEIEADHYVIGKKKPDIISPMAAIPKPEGDVRLIHDCSRPTGRAVNDYCTTDWHQKFSRVDNAAALMTPGCFFAKVDQSSAYRRVKLSPESQKVTGFKWNFDGKDLYLKDTRLPFGGKLSPGIFNHLT